MPHTPLFVRCCASHVHHVLKPCCPAAWYNPTCAHNNLHECQHEGSTKCDAIPGQLSTANLVKQQRVLHPSELGQLRSRASLLQTVLPSAGLRAAAAAFVTLMTYLWLYSYRVLVGLQHSSNPKCICGWLQWRHEPRMRFAVWPHAVNSGASSPAGA